MSGHMYIEMTCAQSSRENYASPIASSKIDKKPSLTIKNDLKVEKEIF
jgi:hypothetical protein